MSSFRGAPIGCGFFAINQRHAWRAEGADIVAVCGRGSTRLAFAGDQSRCPKRRLNYSIGIEIFLSCAPGIKALPGLSLLP
jgi:hypothetical protein